MVSVNYYGGKLRVHRRVNSSSDDEPQPKRKRGITNEGKYTRNVIRKSRVNSTDNKAVRTRAQSASEMQAIESKLDLILSEISEINSQYTRSNCLEIQGVPETSTENVMDLVVAVANVLGFRLETSMVDVARSKFGAWLLEGRGETRILWTNTRKLKDELQYTFAWITSAGKIYLRKSDRQRPILIEDLSDLERLRSTATGGPAAGENGDTAPLTSDTS
ncbi:hypothetical protein J6590_041052 [Homalodisca vitripennis]|nr:hypothetical protein J6590_041052 [Homalodisca vitripennis]